MPCSDCLWISNDIKDPRGGNWCHNLMAYVDPESTCEDWEAQIKRINPADPHQVWGPVNKPPGWPWKEEI